MRTRVKFLLGQACISAMALWLMVGCASGGNFGSGTTTPVSPSSPAVTTKPILVGLVTQGPGTTFTPPANSFEELYAHPGVYSAAVIQLYWSQLEPSQGVFDDSSLVSALAGLAAYNAKYPTTPVVGKLRIFMGIGTPAWVAQVTGPVTLSNQYGSATGGEFWTPAYRTLWQVLQNHLASEYDTNAMVGEVAITSCSSATGEPFILPHQPSDITALHAAGYTDALGMACLSGAAADYAGWKETPLDYTFNAFNAIDSGNDVASTAFSIQVMDSFRANLGTRGVVANHGLQNPLDAGAVPIYTEFQNLYSEAQAEVPPVSSPLEFQTYGPTVDWTSAISLALTYHPTEIEVWDTTAAGGSAPLTLTQLQGWAASLK